MSASNQHSGHELIELLSKPIDWSDRQVALDLTERLVEQLEAAQERLARYEEPGWINSVQAVVAARSALRLVVECEDALTEDGYLYLVEAAREVLGGSGSNPATRRRIEVEIAGDGSGVALPPLEDSVGVEPTPRIAGPELPGASPQDSSPASSGDA